MFAGIVMLNSGWSVASEYKKALSCNLSRQPNEEITELDLQQAYMVRAKVGALNPYDGVLERNPDSVSLLAGEPLGPAGSVPADHELIHEDLAQGRYSTIRTCRCVLWC